MEKINHEEFINRLTQYNWEHDIPGFGFFELTPLCNLDCKMCYVHLQDSSVKDKMLSGDQIISVMKEAIAHGMTRACLSGGEAMTHPDFKQIYMFLIDNGVEVQVKTNGILLDGPRLELFKKYPPIMIDVSLYGCDSESYIAVTGHDVYEKVVYNIRKAIAEDLHIRIAVTASSYMMPWIEDVMRLADSFHVNVVINDSLIAPNAETGRSKKDYDLSISQFDFIDKMKDKIFDPKDLKKELYEPDDTQIETVIYEKGLRCLSGRGMFTLNWDGTMSPCVSFPRKIVVADPINSGFDNAWKEINEAVKNYKIPGKCHGCEISNRCKYCPVNHSGVSHLGLCDDLICQQKINRINKRIQREETI